MIQINPNACSEGEVADFAQQFEKVKTNGSGWLVCCPFHDDKTPSLSIKQEKGTLLCKCFAGCEAFDLFKKNGFFSSSEKRVFKEAHIEYLYRDLSGKPLHKTIKKNGKKFSQAFKSKGGWVFKRDQKEHLLVIYNLPEVTEAIANGSPIFLVEGEKDADTCMVNGVIATTSPMGASSWKKEYAKFLKGADLVLCGDNDSAGIEYIEKVSESVAPLVKRLRIISLPHELNGHKVKDITDWVNASGGLSITDLIGQAEEIELPKQAQSEKGGSKDKYATHSDYVQLFKDNMPELSVDKISRQLMYRDKQTRKWKQALSKGALSIIRSKAWDLDGFAHTRIETEGDRLEEEMQSEARLLLGSEIPKWDRSKDPIAIMTRALNVKNFTALQVEEIFKEWLSGVFHRIDDNYHQNKVPIFYGKQGIGKDYWTTSLVGGFDRYVADLVIHKNSDPKTLGEVLKGAVIARISEFEKSAQVDIATLKDLLTKPAMNFRSAYARHAEEFQLHCSFIASTNSKDIFRDWTGNRRFIFLELEGGVGEAIQRDYPTDQYFQMQILAQAKALYEEGFRISEETKMAMLRDEEKRTPKEPFLAFIEEFEELLSEQVANQYESDGWVYFTEIRDDADRIAKSHSLKWGKIRERAREYFADLGRHREKHGQKRSAAYKAFVAEEEEFSQPHLKLASF